MRSPLSWLALAAFCAASAAPSAAKTVAACPLQAVDFMLVARGQTGHVDRYVVALLLTGADPVTANLQIPGLLNDIPTPVIAPDAAGGESLSHYVLDIPRADMPTGITVYGLLVHGQGDRDMKCREPVRLMTSAPAASLGSFDDSGISASDLLYPRQATEARVLSSTPASYSVPSSELAHARAAIVGVLVGAQGAVLQTKLLQSSDNATLDDAAMAAARKIVFSEPQFAGAPIPLEYRVTYRFGPR